MMYGCFTAVLSSVIHFFTGGYIYAGVIDQDVRSVDRSKTIPTKKSKTDGEDGRDVDTAVLLMMTRQECSTY